MKAVAVPTACSAVTAFLALIFYGAFSHFYGDLLLGRIIMLTASMSLVQLGVVPQSWLYVVGASDGTELRKRFSIGVLAEIGGGLVGICVLTLLFNLPIEFLRNNQAESLLIFSGLWMAGSTSLQGFLRAQGNWRPFAAWILIPNALRVFFVITLPIAASAGYVPSLEDHPFALIGIYFFVPDFFRYILLNLTFLLQRFSLPSIADIIKGLRSIWHNWLFDLGSAFMESGDKILVGTFVGPNLLTAYFFARKIGAAVTIVLEAFYADNYRRIMLASPTQRKERQIAIFVRGMAIGVPISLFVTSVVIAASRAPLLSNYLPEAVLTNLLLFCILLLIDSGIAANRWSRYVSQSGNRSLILLIFRITQVVLFGISLMLLKGFGGLALSLSFFQLWILDVIFLILMLRRSYYSESLCLANGKLNTPK